MCERILDYRALMSLCLMSLVLLAQSAARAQGQPAPTATAGSAPQITEESRDSQSAICKNLTGPIETQFADESNHLMVEAVSKLVMFSGAPYLLFEIGADGKPSGGWRVCVQVRQAAGDVTASQTVGPPYYITDVPKLLGITARCVKDPPGPATCRDALATNLARRGLIAIGAPRLTDQSAGGVSYLSFWVPYKAVQ
jgi:hypothetical protein